MIEKAREATTSQPKLDHVERTAIKFMTPASRYLFDPVGDI